MTILFAGGRTESLIVIGGTIADVLDQDAGNNTWDSAWSDASLKISSSGGIAGVPLYDESMNATNVPPGHTFWFHTAYFSGGMHTYAFLVVYSATAAAVLRVASDGNGNFYVQYNSGTASAPVWTTIGDSVSLNPSSSEINRLDLEMVLAETGGYTANLYLNENLTTAGGQFTPGVDSGLPSIAQVQLNNAGNDIYYSQILATMDQGTVGAHVKTCRATGAGNYQQWTGGYTNVNEPTDNDSTADQATTVGLKQTYPMTTVAVPEGFAIAGVFHWLRAKNDGSAPNNIKSACISGGSEYETADLAGVGVGYSSVGTRYDTDPSTSAAWTQAGWNTGNSGGPVQLGYESDT